MRVILHPKVHSDIDEIMAYYEGTAGPALADDFYAELRQFFADAVHRPESFSVRKHALRRVNLHQFPYHFLFRIVSGSVRILVVRHHRMHPSYGLSRN